MCLIFYAAYCARVITSGIVITDSTVLKDTIFMDSGVSPPYFVENIVVMAATGALTEITIETSSVPRTPIKNKKPSTASG